MPKLPPDFKKGLTRDVEEFVNFGRIGDSSGVNYDSVMDYARRLIIDFGTRGTRCLKDGYVEFRPDQIISAEEIAKQTGAPISYVRKLIDSLKTTKVIHQDWVPVDRRARANGWREIYDRPPDWAPHDGVIGHPYARPRQEQPAISKTDKPERPKRHGRLLATLIGISVIVGALGIQAIVQNQPPATPVPVINPVPISVLPSGAILISSEKDLENMGPSGFSAGGWACVGTGGRLEKDFNFAVDAYTGGKSETKYIGLGTKCARTKVR